MKIKMNKKELLKQYRKLRKSIKPKGCTRCRECFESDDQQEYTNIDIKLEDLCGE